jgi:alpha-glucosidase (family GH31 glycosyl hydrolase)
MLDTLPRDFHSLANSDAIVKHGPVRFTVLTSRLIRLEYAPSEIFEDRATQVVWNRDLPVPAFTHSLDGNRLIIETDELKLSYEQNEWGFTRNSLNIELKSTGVKWHYGMENNSNLMGTVRTLDEADGAVPLNPGLIARTGWSIVDDSHSLVFSEEGWLETRNPSLQTEDFYFFGYGHAYTDCIRDFQTLSGAAPILPRFALGNWWSRYWPYHQDELISLMREFRKHKVPLSVCIVDMDWHIVETGNESSGWTGYTWNPALFPEPQRFLDEIDDLGLETALNLHPASGIYPHESQYREMAARIGVDPDSQAPVPFDIANPDFTKAYFELLHHPMEEMGVDFWWLDWQQGIESTIAGLDPLFWLNHLHFYDRTRDGIKRPFIFSRWGGLGSQRYPIGFSGDTFVTWKTLQFQPYFTATAANVGYGWWSHDIGGHMGGVEEPELYLRWMQYGVFSPILRLHSTNNPFHERRPWGYDAETARHASDAMRLRHALIPYLYTAAWHNYRDGVVPIRPMYHLKPEENDAYLCPSEYAFGSELIAAPFTTPRDPDTRLSRQVVWLPEGDWFDFFSGQHYDGGGWYAVYGGLDRVPVFARSGAIVPLGPIEGWDNVNNPHALTVKVFPGSKNEFELYEDDGKTQAYQDGEFAITTLSQTWSQKEGHFTITPVSGQLDLLPESRHFQIVFESVNEPDTVKVSSYGKTIDVKWAHDASSHKLAVSGIQLPTSSRLEIRIASSEDIIFMGDHRKETLAYMLRSFKMNSYVKQNLENRLDSFLENPTLLFEFADRMKKTHLLAFIETWLGLQPKPISQNPQEAFRAIVQMIYGH